ncbi:MAG: putative nucleotidyltransferase [Cyclobacteriaceae bacterium]|jgi:predicted nucleotidyltransferase
MKTLDKLDIGLSEETKHMIQDVFKQAKKIDQVILYGSRAKGNFKLGSDIDLVMTGALTMSDQLLVDNLLDDLMLPYKIDLSLYSKIDNQDLKDHIERVGVIFYNKNDQ